MKTKIRILHIDDNLHGRQIVKDALQNEQDEFEIIETNNRIEFELHLNNTDFDLVLSEFNILGLEGLKVLQIIKEKKPETPVIIVTDSGSEEIAAEAMKLGAADYVIKSEKHVQNLSPTIKKAIENRKIQDEYKATLLALRKSEERFRLLFNNSIDAVFLNVPHGAILEANTAACNIFGRTEEGLKKAGRNSIIDATDPRLAILLEERSRTGKCNGELTGLRKDGTPFPIEISSALFQDNDGNARSSMIIRDITERKRMEESLQESEGLYRNLFESLLNGFAYCRMIFDKEKPNDFIYLRINKAFEKLTGLKDVVGKKVSEVIPGIQESDPEIFEIYGRVALTGKSETFEIYVEALKMWLLISVYSPQKEYFVAIFDAITNRKQAEEALKASEVRYRRLFESAKDGILILDAETGIIVDVNPYLVELLGYSTEQFHGKKIWEIGAFTDVIANQSKFLELQQKEYVRYDDLPLKTSDGRKIAVEFVSNVYEVNKQKVIQCNIRNITDRKKAEEQQIIQTTALEATAINVVITNAEGTIIWVNNAFTITTGYSKEEAIGKSPSILKSGKHDKSFYKNLWNTIKAGKVWQGEVINKRKDDSLLTDEMTITPVLDKNGVVRNFIALNHDITERKRERDALSENEQLLSNTQKFAHIGSFNLFLNSKELRWSDELYHILGLQKDTFKVTAESFMNCIHPDDRNSMQNWIRKTSSGINTEDLDFRIVKPDGSIRNIYGSGKLQSDTDGKPHHIIGSAQDITERKNIEKALKESEEKFRSLLENSADAIFITNPMGKYIFTNKAATDLLGYSSEEMLLKTIAVLTPKDKIRGYFEFLTEIKSKGKIFAEIELLKKDGNYVSTDLNSVLLPDGNVFASCRDITERKQAEAEILNLNANLELRVEERTEQLAKTNKNLWVEIGERKQTEESLRTSEDRLHLATIAGNIGIWDWDVVKNELSWDDSMYLLYGIRKEDFSGAYESWRSTLHPDDRKFVEDEVQAAIRGEREYAPEFRIVQPDGAIRIIKAASQTFREQNGKALRMIGTCIDITEQKHAEEEIKEAKVQAEQANKAKSEFLSNMSHEIRTPMNAVLGYAELLNNVLEDKTQKDYLKSIMSSGKTLLTLINDILDLSKIEAGKLELSFDYVNTLSFFSEFERIFSWKVAEKGLTFILDIVSGMPAGIYVDETRLRQIILNIIGNAVKFTSKGHIKLKVYLENPHVVKLSNEKSEEFIDLVLEIEDTGIGISREFQDHIFEPFSQEQHKNQFGGTGLGLAITRRLLDLMNGTIQFQSKLKKGTTFQIKIPNITYLRDFEGAPESIQIDPANIVFEKAKILIVDDVALNRKYFVDALKNSNIEIIEAEDGLTAYNLAKDIVPDIIVTDLRMPKLNGFGLLKKIQGNAKLSHIPIIAYSASAMKEQKEHIFNCKFSGFLIKPVRVTDLYIELMNYLPYKSIRTLEKDNSTQQGLLEINDMQGLIHSLETVYTNVWKKFAVRQPMDEVKEFGGNLENLGNAHNAEIIKKYGNELMTAAENFNIDSILKLLHKYQGIVEKIKEYQSNN